MQTFRIAGLTVQISAEKPLETGEKWSKFRTSASCAQLRYDVRYAPVLPPSDGEVLYDAPGIKIVRQAQGKRYIYSNLCTSRQTASALELPSDTPGRQITLLSERFPWGTAVEHLFELYDFSHFLPMFGRMLLHCACVLHRGKAILFTAPSGTGKTTQAELWRSLFRAQIVNGDRAAVGVTDAAAMAYALPFSGSSCDCENIDAPIAAVVSLAQGRENRVQTLRGTQALRALMRGAYVLPQHGADLPQQLAVAQAVVQRVPCYRLECLPEASAARLLASVFCRDGVYSSEDSSLSDV